MSVIQDIYTSISNMTVGDVSARNIDEVDLAVVSGDLPVRLLLPSTRGQMEFVAIGNLQNMTWAIRDLCLFAPLKAGSGIEQYASAMVDYISLYLAQIKANRNPATQSHIIGMEVEMGHVPWGNSDYWGIDITLTVEEIL